jgi:glucose dehydrogenase
MTIRSFLPFAVCAVFPFLVVTQGAQSPQGTQATQPPQGGGDRRPNARATVAPVSERDLMNGAAGDWLTYHGSYSANHYSTLAQVDARNVVRL